MASLMGHVASINRLLAQAQAGLFFESESDADGAYTDAALDAFEDDVLRHSWMMTAALATNVRPRACLGLFVIYIRTRVEPPRAATDEITVPSLLSCSSGTASCGGACARCGRGTAPCTVSDPCSSCSSSVCDTNLKSSTARLQLESLPPLELHGF